MAGFYEVMDFILCRLLSTCSHLIVLYLHSIEARTEICGWHSRDARLAAWRVWPRSVRKEALKSNVPRGCLSRAAQSPARTQRAPLQSFRLGHVQLLQLWRASEKPPKPTQNRDLGVGGLAGAAKPSRRPGVGARRAAHSRRGPYPEAVPSLSPHTRMVRTRKAERPCCRNRQISPFPLATPLAP